jgi:hypothetical protein
MSDRISALTVKRVRERLGREPTTAEWVAIVRAAAVERDFIESVERTRELLLAAQETDPEMSDEVEKALEILTDLVEWLGNDTPKPPINDGLDVTRERAALRSLRMHHARDQAKIAELERVLTNLGAQLNAGGSGDPAGGEVE